MNKAFWKAALIRSLRTFCQAFIAACGSNAVMLSDVNWLAALSTATLAAILSVINSIATGLPEAE